MQATYWLNKVEEMEATLQLTMTVEEWKQIAATLADAKSYPHWKVAGVIHNLINKANKTFSERIDDER